MIELASRTESAPVADVDIGIIFTYEDRLMSDLLSSLAGAAVGTDPRLLLVNNASRQGVDRWTSHFANTQVIHNDRRLGYAANLNRILEAATAPYVLLLNTDVFFHPHERCLARMLDFMEAHPDCGISTCRVYHPDGSFAFPARSFQTWRSIAARRLRLGGVFTNSVKEYLNQDRDPGDSFDCDWISGCFMLARREAVTSVGSFATEYPKYFEDVDICLRLAAAGWRVMYHGQTYCFHWEQRSSRHVFSKDAWHHLWSYMQWIRKWGLNPSKHIRRRRLIQNAA